jgi:hypothetical protein
MEGEQMPARKYHKNPRERASTKARRDQLKLPAGYSANGKKLATLREVLDPETSTMNMSQLTDKQRLELVAKRIAMQPDFKIAMLGAGLIDKKRAIQEVKSGTRIGRNLVEIEQRLLNHLMEEAQKKKS